MLRRVSMGVGVDEEGVRGAWRYSQEGRVQKAG